MTIRRRLFLMTPLALVVLLVLYYTSNSLFYPVREPTHDYGNRLHKKNWSRNSFKSAEFCKACHEEIYNQWKESYLSKSVESSAKEMALHRLTLQLRGMDENEVRFCLECHAPLALTEPEDLTLEDELSREGVTCMVCHAATKAHVNTNPAHIEWDPGAGMAGPFDDAFSPVHGIVANDLFVDRENRLCATCHYSTWPRSGMPIDWTYEEWLEAGGPEGGRNCVECHMPEYIGKAANLPGVPERVLRKHTFVGGHDPGTVAGSALLEVTPNYKPGRTRLRIAVVNQAGHSMPSGNPPAPELRLSVVLTDGTETEFIEGRSYRFDYVLENGKSTHDVTVAYAVGNDTSLLAYERREETVEIVHRDLPSYWLEHGDPQIEISLEFSYWRPYEPSERFSSYTNTIYDHLSNTEVNLGSLVRTFIKGSSWASLYNAIGTGKGTPLPVDRVSVPLLESSDGATASAGG